MSSRLEKQCTKCYKTLPINEFWFYKSGERKGRPRAQCKKCLTEINRSTSVWVRIYRQINSRCVNRAKRYFYRGIKNYLSVEDIRYLWFRDKAYSMEKPSVDRINNDGDYTRDNCRFIEHRLNASLGGKIGSDIFHGKRLPIAYKIEIPKGVLL